MARLEAQRLVVWFCRDELVLYQIRHVRGADVGGSLKNFFIGTDSYQLFFLAFSLCRSQLSYQCRIQQRVSSAQGIIDRLSSCTLVTLLFRLASRRINMVEGDRAIHEPEMCWSCCVECTMVVLQQKYSTKIYLLRYL